jgi:hypothetical protein
MPAPLLLAVALDCSLVEPPRVEIQFVQNEPAVRRDLNMLQLANRRDPKGSGMPRTLGLTEAQMRVVTRLGTETYRSGMEVCLQPSLVRIELRIDSTIFIARELTNQPCRREQAMRHEREHVAIDRRIATEAIPRYREAVETTLAEIGPIGPIAPGQVAAAIERVRARLRPALKRVTDQLYADRKTAQNALDTPEEYRRLWAACGRKL